MCNFTINPGIDPSLGLPNAQVLLIGQSKLIRSLNFDGNLSKKLHLVDPIIFKDAVSRLPTNGSGSLPLYLDLAKLITVSDEVSRCNTPSNSYAIFKELKATPISNGIKNLSIVLFADYHHILACISAIARAFPTYTRKTNIKQSLENINVEIVTDKALEDKDIKFLQSVAESIRICQRQVDTPANELHTEAFLADAQALIEEIRASGVEITDEVIKGEDLKTQGFGGIFHVGKAARHPPIFARFSYQPPGATTSYALVGKGIVYDTGGMQLKTKTGMPTMKRDMAGAAALLGAFCALVKSGFTQTLHLCLCMAENNISPDANKPDDIIEMLSGKTVEINNTDAEGRLVLADGVYYAKTKLGAKNIIDMATLTGAQAYATGKLICAVLTNKEECERYAMEAGRRSGDLVYPLPYCPDLHFGDLKSSLADMKNSNLSGKTEGPPSAIAGVLIFLIRVNLGLFIASHIDFTNDVNWFHFDIAAPAESGERSTGFGVSLVCSLLNEHLNDIGVAK